MRRAISFVLCSVLLLAATGCGSDPQRAPAAGTRMGPPPPGYVKITGEPVPDWQPSHLERGPSALAWTPLGPRPIADELWSGSDDASGRVVSIAPHPSDPDTVYIASASGGVWKTVDGGVTWTPLTDELSILNHGCVALDPALPDTVYAATGEYTTLSTGDGLFRSTDAGASWERIGTVAEVGGNCSGLIVDPSDGATIHMTGRFGYVRTTDGGTTWTRTLAGQASALLLDPSDPDVLYAALRTTGVYRSDDAGATWTQLTGGLPVAGFVRVVMGLAASSPSTVYAAFINAGGGLLGLYRTDDGGTAWTHLANTPDFPTPQGTYDAFVGVDPSAPDTVYAGGVFPTYAVAGVTKSTDGGATWNDVTIGSIAGQLHPDMHTIAFAADGSAWVGNDGGVWKSADGGQTWINTNATLAVTQHYAIALHPTDPAQLMGGTQDNGTVARDLGTDAWPQILAGDGGYLAYDFVDPNRRYVTYVRLDVYRLVGTTLTSISGPWGGDPRNFIAPLAMDPNDEQTLLGGTNRVWRTQNAAGAASWTAISTNTVLGGSLINALAAAQGASNTIYAGSAAGQVAVTLDAASWENRSDGLPVGQISDILIDPAAPGTAYVGYYRTTGARLLRTTDFGLTWTDVTGDLPEGVAARAVAVDWRTVPDDTIYLGSGAGVYWSTDGGATWTKDGSDLPNVNIGDLAIDFDNDTLYAGTYGRGAWRATLFGVVPPFFADGFESGDTLAWGLSTE